MSPVDFRVAISEDDLADLMARVRRARLPSVVEGAGWSYGTDRDYMAGLLDYWRERYDWRAEERKLNAWPQYLIDIDGCRLHYVHVRSAHAEALPLVLTHGWPGTWYELHPVIDALVAPERHGGEARDAFHVICPSLTGYAWSEPWPKPGCDIRFAAERQVKLMRALGYKRYGVQGGDWGALASSYMAILDPGSVAGVHLNMCPAPSTDDPEEAKAQGVVPGRSALIREYVREQKGYAVIQSLKPDQLAYALNDSPLGLAAWMICCFQAWGDTGGRIESRFDYDYLITTALVFWFSASMPSAIRLYRESMRAGRFGPPDTFVAAPTAVAMFKDLSRPKRAWAERCYNIERWTEFERGGHFAALEEPALLVEDIRAFFRDRR